jgi:serine/threonine protein phosphatase PrpC
MSLVVVSLALLLAVVLVLVAVFWRRAPSPVPSPARRETTATPEAPRPVPAPDPAPKPAELMPSPKPDMGGDSDLDVTQMGAVPPEVLAMMRGKVSGDMPVPGKPGDEEEFVDIDVQDLVDPMLAEDPTGTHALIVVSGFARSDRGRKRKCNEDAFLILPDEPLFVVADGMGGHNAGDVASQMAVDIFQRAFETKDFGKPLHSGWPRRGDELVRCVHMANEAIYAKAQTDPAFQGMGTTIVAMRVSPNKGRVYIAHVGDSRCYRVRDGQLFQLTEDHTLGNLLGRTGKEARFLARAVGVRPDVPVDLTIDVPKPGDLYVVCSDGLTKMVPDQEILRLVMQDGDLDTRAKYLIDEANARGGKDNITAIVVRVETAREAVARAQRR